MKQVSLLGRFCQDQLQSLSWLAVCEGESKRVKDAQLGVVSDKFDGARKKLQCISTNDLWRGVSRHSDGEFELMGPLLVLGPHQSPKPLNILGIVNVDGIKVHPEP